VSDVADKLVSIALSLAILGQAWLAARRLGTWVAPAPLYGLFWFLFTVIPLALLFPVPSSPLAMGYLLLTCLAFSASALPFDAGAAVAWARREGPSAPPLFDSAFLRRTFYGLSAAIPVLLVLNSRAQGISIGDAIFNVLASAAIYAELRNQELVVANVWQSLSNVAIYVATALGGFVFLHERPGWRRWAVSVVALLPSVVVMVTQSAKGMFFLCAAFFVAAIWVGRLRRGELGLASRRARRPLAVAVALTVLLVGVSFLSRGFQDADDRDVVTQGLTRYFASYTSGHLYAFSDWFSDRVGRPSTLHYAPEPPTYGFYTVMPIFEALGSSKQVPAGVYDEYFRHEELLTSNIYTMYRGLITDFGLVGSLVFMLVTGLLFHLAWFHLLVDERPVVPAVVFIYMVGYFYTSFIISLFIWRSVYAGFLGLLAVLWLDGWLQRQPEARPLAAPPS
jgi:oligosaccharide repeat unit polymerase